jgi:hypothetical protein
MIRKMTRLWTKNTSVLCSSMGGKNKTRESMKVTRNFILQWTSEWIF